MSSYDSTALGLLTRNIINAEGNINISDLFVNYSVQPMTSGVPVDTLLYLGSSSTVNNLNIKNIEVANAPDRFRLVNIQDSSTNIKSGVKLDNTLVSFYSTPEDAVAGLDLLSLNGNLSNSTFGKIRTENGKPMLVSSKDTSANMQINNIKINDVYMDNVLSRPINIALNGSLYVGFIKLNTFSDNGADICHSTRRGVSVFIKEYITSLSSNIENNYI